MSIRFKLSGVKLFNKIENHHENYMASKGYLENQSNRIKITYTKMKSKTNKIQKQQTAKTNNG